MKFKAIPFSAKIELIGINPFVYLPEDVLREIFVQAERNKGKIPVKIKIEGHEFIQTLVKYAGDWRLYLNTPMRKAAKKELGDKAHFEIAFDPEKREVPMHPKFKAALETNKEAKNTFEALPASRKAEILKYLSFLKTEASVEKNVSKAINFLLGKERFIGSDKP